MIDFPIVDSHVHLADPGRFSYAWTANAPSLNRTVLPKDLNAAAAPHTIDKLVFVEVDVDMPQYLDEAAWISGMAATEPQIAGMVACLPLEQGDGIAADLEKLCDHDVLRGIRRLIQNQSDPDYCLQPDFLAGLKLLAARDLVFDICIFHHQMPNTLEMVRRCPDNRFVLDHIGKPAIRDGLFDPWRAHMRELASMENVVCKISGVSTEADHANWTREEIRPYIEHAIDCFGFDRCMFGGDWHVVELAGPYPQWVDIVDWITAGASEDERRALFRDTAIDVYRL